MKIKQKNMMVWAALILTVFAADSFAYSRQMLSAESVSTIKIIKTKLDQTMHPKIIRSPDLINRLRLIFLSNKKNKTTR